MRFLRAGACIALVMGLVTVTAAQNSAQAEKQFQAALEKEMVAGDLKGAIAIYKEVVAQAGSNRALAAKALLRMAETHQKLGDAEAQKIYQQLASDYADHPEAKTARERLGQVASTTVRQMWAIAKGDQTPMRVSPDGQWIVYQSKRNLFLRPFSTGGADRQLTVTGGQSEAPREAAFSRDGRQLAFSWTVVEEKGPGKDELRVMTIGTSGTPEPRTLFVNPDVLWITPFDWTPDGRFIAAGLLRRDFTFQVSLISTATGSLTVLKSLTWQRAENAAISPDGKFLALDLPATDRDSRRDVKILAVDGSQEAPVAPHAAHEVLIGWSQSGRELVFLSDRGGTPGVWVAPVAEGRPQGPAIEVRAEMGRIQPLGLAADRLFYEIGTEIPRLDIYLAPFDIDAKTIAEPVSVSKRSPVGGVGAVWSGDGRMIAYLSQRRQLDPPGFSLTIKSVDSDQVVQVLRPQLEDLSDLAWAPDGKSFLGTGRDFRGRYALVQVDAQTAAVRIIEADSSGVTARGGDWSADGSRIYFRRRTPIAGGTPGFQDAIIEREMASGRERELYRRDSGSIVAAILSPDGKGLAIVQGMGGRGQTLQLIDSSSGAARELSSDERLTLFGWSADSQSVLAGRGRYPDQVDLMRIPIAGGPPVEGPRLPRGWGHSLDPNGGRLSYFTSDQPLPPAREVWLLENFLPRAPAKR